MKNRTKYLPLVFALAMCLTACAAFEKLPLIQDEEILRNILYSGVWLGYNEYLHKKEQKNKMKKETEVTGHGE